MKQNESFFADKLKEIMIEKNVNQSELAKKIGVIQQQISFWITGRHKPSLSSIKKISVALDIPYNYFLEKSDDKETDDSYKKDIENLQLKNRILELEKEVLKLEKENFELKSKLKDKK